MKTNLQAEFLNETALQQTRKTKMEDRDINSLALQLAGAIQKMREKITDLEKELRISNNNAHKWRKIADKLNFNEPLTNDEADMLSRTKHKNYSNFYPKQTETSIRIWKTK